MYLQRALCAYCTTCKLAPVAQCTTQSIIYAWFFQFFMCLCWFVSVTARECNQTKCQGMAIPNEFTLPGYYDNNNLVAETNITNKLTFRFQNHTSNDYMLVVFVDDDPKNLCFYQQQWPTRSLKCKLDPSARRPTHGVYALCQNFCKFSFDRVTDALMREVMQIIAGSFVGSRNPSSGCTDLMQVWPSRCKKQPSLNF